MQISAVNNYFKTNFTPTFKNQATLVREATRTPADSFKKTILPEVQEATDLYWKAEKIARRIGYAASSRVETIGKDKNEVKVVYEMDENDRITKIIFCNESLTEKKNGGGS